MQSDAIALPMSQQAVLVPVSWPAISDQSPGAAERDPQDRMNGAEELGETALISHMSCRTAIVTWEHDPMPERRKRPLAALMADRRGPLKFGAGLTVAVVGVLSMWIAGCGASSRGSGPARTDRTVSRLSGSEIHANLPPAVGALQGSRHAPFAVGLQVLSFIDRTRLIRLPGGRLVPRTLVTLVRYPASGPATRVAFPGAQPDRFAGPFPLVVFGHGFAVTPAIYASLLTAWARAGYVVAARPSVPTRERKCPGRRD